MARMGRVSRGIAVVVRIRLGGTQGGMNTLRETILFVGAIRGLDLLPGFPEGEGESCGDIVILSLFVIAVVILGVVVFDC